MSVDLGLVRTGVAFCDKSEMLATPAGNIEERDENVLAKKIAAMADDRGAELIVVGYPVNMNGTIGPRAEKCSAIADKIQKYTKSDVVLWDERSTTVSAYVSLKEGNVKGRKKKGIVDSLAAAIILESYLDYRKNMSKNN